MRRVRLETEYTNGPAEFRNLDFRLKKNKFRQNGLSGPGEAGGEHQRASSNTSEPLDVVTAFPSS